MYPTQPPIPTISDCFPKGEGAEEISYHMTPSGADGKNVWSCTSGLTVCLHDRDIYRYDK